MGHLISGSNCWQILPREKTNEGHTLVQNCMKDETASVKESELHWALAIASPCGLCVINL